MNYCQVCNSKLVTEGLISGQQIRCANCQSLSRFGKVEKIATHRLAWRSFWLGISSILFLTITGIPAIYYGIRSLLRMRFVKPARSDRVAAIIGTSLGGCFGVFVGFIVVCSLIIGLIQFWTSNQTVDPDEVAERCSQSFEFLSPHVVPIQASSFMNTQYLFEFADKPKADDRKLGIRLVFIRAGVKFNGALISQKLQQQGLGKKKFGSSKSSELLEWQLGEQSMEVEKRVYSDAEEETHRQFWGFIQNHRGIYGMLVVFEPDTHDFSDSDVKEIFASTRIVDE
jgi:hypothetical protein